MQKIHHNFHLFPVQSKGARLGLALYTLHKLPKLPGDLSKDVHIHNMDSFISRLKSHVINWCSYNCFEPNCFVHKTL